MVHFKLSILKVGSGYKTPNNKTPKNKTPNATKRLMQKNAQCNRTPKIKRPMQQKAQNKIKNAQIP